MGIDLVWLANHSIDFQKPYEKASEVESILNSINYNIDKIYSGTFETKKPAIWHANYWDDKDEEHPEYNSLTCYFEASEDFDICMNRYTFNMCNPFLRYRILSRLDDPQVLSRFLSWRKEFIKIVKAMGGDRIIYLPDSGSALEKFFYMGDDEPFEAIETAIKQEYGQPVKSIIQLREDPHSLYFIDRLDEVLK